MIRAEQIPDEAVEALHTSLADDAGVLVPKSDCVTAIAAALNAWPNVFVNGSSESIFVCCHSLVLPLPQEASDV